MMWRRGYKKCKQMQTKAEKKNKRGRVGETKTCSYLNAEEHNIHTYAYITFTKEKQGDDEGERDNETCGVCRNAEKVNIHALHTCIQTEAQGDEDEENVTKRRRRRRKIAKNLLKRTPNRERK